MTEASDAIIAWKFDVAVNAMGGERLTAYVNRSDRQRAWEILRAKMPHADLMSAVGLSQDGMSMDNERPFLEGEDLRFVQCP